MNPHTLRLGCTPIINLTAHTAEPIQMDQTKYEYRVAPDFRHNRVQEVFSVDDVTCIYEKTGEIEARLEALNAEDEGIRNFEQKQADSTSSMGHKFSALEKAVIKLSLAVQEAQFASQITVVTNPATSPATNGANATNPDAEQ